MEHLLNNVHNAFAYLQGYVTDKAIAHDHIGLAGIKVSSFNILAVAITAAVFPAETTPWAAPSRTRREAMRIELSFFVRTALAALSSIVICSLAWRTWMSERSHSC